MPHLTFATSSDGPALEVVIGPDGKMVSVLQQAGAPSPVRVRGLIDTACDVTAVAPRLLQQLGAVRIAGASTLTAAGSVSVNVSTVSLIISGPTVGVGPMFVRRTLVVTELATPLPNIDVLIGRDILAECLFQLDGPGGRFLLGF